MAATLVRGKYIITRVTGPASAETLTESAVLVEDGGIAKIGPFQELKAAHPETEVVGSSNYVVMPGLVNDHFHVGLTPFQLGAPDLPLELWMFARMGQRDVDPYLDQLYGAVQMIESGATTVQALHSSRRGGPPIDLAVAGQAINAFRNSGMRVAYAAMAADQNATVSGRSGGEEELASRLPDELAGQFRAMMAARYLPVKETVELLDRLCSQYARPGYEKVRITLAPSNVHRCSDELLIRIKDLAAKYETGIHIHLQETVYQRLYGQTAWGKTPLQHLNDLGFLGPEVTCGHSVWVTEEDIAIMAATGVSVCHNASSNLRLQSGIAPLGRLLEAGIKVALGSDEAGLNDDKDLFQEMRLVLKLHRVPGMEHTPPTACQVLEMATVNGAAASCFGDRIGTLEVGKRADLVLVDLRNIEEPFLDPEVSMVDAVVHRARSIDVDTVMVDGEIVMRGRQLTKVDKEQLFKDLRKSLDRPLSAAEIGRRETARKLEPHVREFYRHDLPSDMTPYAAYNARE